MSNIPQPVTENYKFQAFTTIISNKKNIKKREMTPLYPLVTKYNNTNYKELVENKFKYMFVYEFDLEDFLNPSADSVSRARFISHDQIRLNFGADLFVSKNQILTPGDVQRSSTLSSRLSNQYGNTGITLGKYIVSVIFGLPLIIKKFPFNMANMEDFHPVFDVIDYPYVDLLGNVTVKTTTFAAMKYSYYSKHKKRIVSKVLFWGTGLQEFIVGK